MPGWEIFFGYRLYTASILLMVAMALCAGIWAPSAEASAKPYIHPDYIFAHQLRHKHRVAPTVNINRAGLAELKTLPGMDENTALKVIRLRKIAPLRSTTDLYRLPWLDRREVDLLIDRIKNGISF
jgi:predicted DNA-binding helix-hairpin-helix protein